MTKLLAERVDEALRVTGRLVALAGTTAVLFFALGVVLKPLFPDGLPRGPEGRQLYLLLLVLALGVAQVVMVAVAEKGNWRHTGLGEGGWSPWASAAGIGIGSLTPLAAAGLGRLAGGPGTPLSWVWPATSVLLLVIASTLADALMLRGYAIGLLAHRWGQVTAVSLTALLATLFAIQGEAPTPLGALDAFVMAVCLGTLRLRTGSLLAAWLAHVLMELVLDGLGTLPEPGITAGLLSVVTFLLFRLRSRTSRPRRA